MERKKCWQDVIIFTSLTSHHTDPKGKLFFCLLMLYVQAAHLPTSKVKKIAVLIRVGSLSFNMGESFIFSVIQHTFVINHD